jgi:hypothetical protein
MARDGWHVTHCGRARRQDPRDVGAWDKQHIWHPENCMCARRGLFPAQRFDAFTSTGRYCHQRYMMSTVSMLASVKRPGDNSY